MWNIKLKLRHRQQYGGYQREGMGRVVKGKGSQIYADGRRSDFGWCAHSAIYKSCIM